jgi:hypothetical protein
MMIVIALAKVEHKIAKVSSKIPLSFKWLKYFFINENYLQGRVD